MTEEGVPLGLWPMMDRLVKVHGESPSRLVAEEVDRRIAADHAREEEFGLKSGRAATARADTAVEVDREDPERPNQSDENAA
jgi:hypothetical protein